MADWDSSIGVELVIMRGQKKLFQVLINVTMLIAQVIFQLSGR